MKRETHRIILPKEVRTTPNEGMLSMEAIRIKNHWRIVSYLTEEEYLRQREEGREMGMRCPITGEEGLLNRNWTNRFNLNQNTYLLEGPAIIPTTTCVYVASGDQYIARFYANKGVCFDLDQALFYASLFVDALNNENQK